LAGFADERFALFIFVSARRFTNEHQLSVRIADAEDNSLARRSEVRAFDARERALPQIGEGGGFGFGA
jgi:hypothetical protein